jgi:hypothetical protein
LCIFFANHSLPASLTNARHFSLQIWTLVIADQIFWSLHANLQQKDCRSYVVSLNLLIMLTELNQSIIFLFLTVWPRGCSSNVPVEFAHISPARFQVHDQQGTSW